MHSAIGITDNSISKVTKRTLSIFNEDSYRDIRVGEGGDDEREKEGGDEDIDGSDERVWREILDSRKRSVLRRPCFSQYTPEKPKLTSDMINKLEPSCNLAVSCVPLSRIPAPLLNLYQQHRNDQFNIKSLRGEPALHTSMIKIFDVEDNDNNRANFAFELWKYHERSFWIERIVPLFKYLGVNDQIVFSWCEDHVMSNQENQRDPGDWLNSKNNTFSDGIGRTNIQQGKIFMESSSGFYVEDFGRTVGDTYKIVESITSSLSIMMRRKQDCKFSSVLNLAVYGIQCTKNRLTLMKTTLDPHSDRFQIVELRSSSIPTIWAQRTGMIKVFEILVCLHNELKEQRLLEDLLLC
ncbi:hypothetical protein G6F43_008386 [Rhizopus delemar]|nr:hypothetical protein G6F43_008386 [Rhizopus delemar]